MKNLSNTPSTPNSLPIQGGFVDYKGEYFPSTNGGTQMHSMYRTAKVRGENVHDRVLFNRYRLNDKDSQESKDICQVRGGDYVFKKDAIKLFGASRLRLNYGYVLKDSESLIQIEYISGARKLKANFACYQDIAKIGIFKVGEDEVFPESMREKYATIETIKSVTGLRSYELFFVSSGDVNRNSDIFKNLQVYTINSDVYQMHREQGDRTITANSLLRFSVISDRVFSVYGILTEENSVYDQWENNGRRIMNGKARSFFAFNETTGTIEAVNVSDVKFDELIASGRRETGINFTYNWKSFITGKMEKIAGLRVMKLQGTERYYANLLSARMDMANDNFTIDICPHCGQMHRMEEHDTRRCAERNARPMRFDYHSQQPTHDTAKLQGAQFKIGVEIEKEDITGACYNHREIFDRFGWVKERDGSLDSTRGYELVSPMFNLMKSDLIDQAREIEAKYPSLINGEYSRACGGHIHFSEATKSGRETLEDICGYLPLIYAIYKHRTERTYCQATEKESMKFSSDKYQAVRIFDNRIEFRIFPAVKNIETLEWRINLLQVMATNPTNSPVQVVNTLMDESSDLYKLFARIFDKKTIYKRAVDSLKLAKKYDRNYFNIDFTPQIQDIERQATAL